MEVFRSKGADWESVNKLQKVTTILVHAQGVGNVEEVEKGVSNVEHVEEGV